MNLGDLVLLEELLESATGVVSMRQVFDGATAPDLIGLRHDVDDNPDSLQTAVRMAEWEQERGYHATYYLLHSAGYWLDDGFQAAVERIAECGHEIGIHANAIAESLRGRGDATVILSGALGELRSYGHKVTGVAAHGDILCHQVGFVNDEQFVECARPEMGAPDRELTYGDMCLTLAPRPLADFGLDYDTHRLPHGRYLSDSGGEWNEPFPGVGSGQLHMLWHPDWWAEAFPDLRIAA